MRTLKNLGIEFEGKTIWEVPHKPAGKDGTEIELQMVYVKDLRQAAIEWIKELELKKDYSTLENSQESIWNEVTIRWIKHFFNITGEDLK